MAIEFVVDNFSKTMANSSIDYWDL